VERRHNASGLHYKAEHAADLKTEMIVAAEISPRTWVTGRHWMIR
jgi:hypothetical protein